MLIFKGLGYRVYENLINPFNKHLEKSYKTLAKRL